MVELDLVILLAYIPQLAAHQYFDLIYQPTKILVELVVVKH